MRRKIICETADGTLFIARTKLFAPAKYQYGYVILHLLALHFSLD